MRCTSPRPVGFLADGKTITWSSKQFSREYATFQLPCGKCIECRLEQSREKATRCVHEAKMYDKNSFLTLTYDDDHLPENGKLIYNDFQLFIGRLRKQAFRNHLKKINLTIETYNEMNQKDRKRIYDQIITPFIVTGEYGEKLKRPHWHAIMFNWEPEDGKHKYTSELSHKVYESETLTKLWGKGIAEYGSVTFDSAAYVCRYSAKKLVHGNDQDHDFQPIHKMSSKHAIGKKFLEKYYPDIFNHGYVVLQNGQKIAIPRYYEKWLKKHHPDEWESYIMKLKSDREIKAIKQVNKEKEKSKEILIARGLKGHEQTRNSMRKIINNQKFKTLMKYLKGDI